MGNERQWKNPYAISKKRSAIARKKAEQIKRKGNVAYLTRQNQEGDVRYTVFKMRDGIKQASHVMQEMDQAINSFIGLLDLLDGLGISTSKNRRKDVSLSPQEIIKKLNHIDFKQIVELLQSPVIQSLLSNNLSDDRDNLSTAKEG